MKEEEMGGVSLVPPLLPGEHPPFLPEASDRGKDCNGSVDVYEACSSDHC